MTKTMTRKTTTQTGLGTLALAFLSSGFSLRKTRNKSKRWPRLKGPRGLRIDCSTGHAVGVEA